MLKWSVGIVQHAAEPLEGLQEAAVLLADGSSGKAVYYYEEGTKRTLAPGDQVLLNTTAVSQNLGTGGYHFIHTVLPSNSSCSPEQLSAVYNNTEDHTEGHIVKLRYTSLQRTVLAVEEPASRYHELFSRPLSLEGMPVLIGELHSMLPVVLCRIRQLERRQNTRCRVAYIMSDGGALPIAFSRHVRRLKQQEWLTGTVTYGHAYGGEVEAVNKYTALLAAKHVLQADIAVVIMGPGSVGTGTRLGFSGLETGELINAAAALGGEPIVIPRISFLDPRERHRGLSHHLLTALTVVSRAQARVPLPELSGAQGQRLREQLAASGIETIHRLSLHEPIRAAEWDQALEAYPEPILSMGREVRGDMAGLAGMGAAADEAWQCWRDR
ncbi:DUF3866 family protein [Paenibacillus sp. TAB 01]|uniref:DUF3866 family protein n=1 Tax=Paenibacillus sp. TAB 01 TaxID=3368988 RepID=UPI003750DB75